MHAYEDASASGLDRRAARCRFKHRDVAMETRATAILAWAQLIGVGSSMACIGMTPREAAIDVVRHISTIPSAVSGGRTQWGKKAKF
jgi:hypothetical protein